MAASLPNGNLIVPVIKNADQLNLVGMAKAVNDLGGRAKAGKLRRTIRKAEPILLQWGRLVVFLYTNFESATSWDFSSRGQKSACSYRNTGR
jgi:hypothetical protein